MDLNGWCVYMRIKFESINKTIYDIDQTNQMVFCFHKKYILTINNKSNDFINIPDFDKTSALIKSSAESANSISVVGVSPVLIVMDGGPVVGIGTSIYNCVIFSALLTLFLKFKFYSFYSFNSDVSLLIFTR